jgi:hypothetical protein
MRGQQNLAVIGRSHLWAPCASIVRLWRRCRGEEVHLAHRPPGEVTALSAEGLVSKREGIVDIPAVRQVRGRVRAPRRPAIGLGDDFRCAQGGLALPTPAVVTVSAVFVAHRRYLTAPAPKRPRRTRPTQPV